MGDPSPAGSTLPESVPDQGSSTHPTPPPQDLLFVGYLSSLDPGESVGNPPTREGGADPVPRGGWWRTGAGGGTGPLSPVPSSTDLRRRRPFPRGTGTGRGPGGVRSVS